MDINEHRTFFEASRWQSRVQLQKGAAARSTKQPRTHPKRVPVGSRRKCSKWPRIARYRETISAIPPYCALWGFWCLNMANWVRYPLLLFWAFPLGEHAKWRCDTPPLKRGISAILARYPMKTRQMSAIPPSAILSRKGIARYGGVSRLYAAKKVLKKAAEKSPNSCFFFGCYGSLRCFLFMARSLRPHRHPFRVFFWSALAGP